MEKRAKTMGKGLPENRLEHLRGWRRIPGPMSIYIRVDPQGDRRLRAEISREVVERFAATDEIQRQVRRMLKLLEVDASKIEAADRDREGGAERCSPENSASDSPRQNGGREGSRSGSYPAALTPGIRRRLSRIPMLRGPGQKNYQPQGQARKKKKRASTNGTSRNRGATRRRSS